MTNWSTTKEENIFFSHDDTALKLHLTQNSSVITAENSSDDNTEKDNT